MPKDRFNDDDMITETRVRFLCTISASSEDQFLDIKTDKVIYRICNHEETDCQQTGKFYL